MSKSVNFTDLKKGALPTTLLNRLTNSLKFGKICSLEYNYLIVLLL